jgi:hypothetical protein
MGAPAEAAAAYILGAHGWDWFFAILAIERGLRIDPAGSLGAWFLVNVTKDAKLAFKGKDTHTSDEWVRLLCSPEAPPKLP